MSTYLHALLLATMRQVSLVQFVDIPENIEVTAKSRHVTVKNKENGKVLERTFKHMRMEMTLVDDGKKLKIEAFFANKKERASLRTNAAHIRNMITGVIQVCVVFCFYLNVPSARARPVDVRGHL